MELNVRRVNMAHGGVRFTKLLAISSLILFTFAFSCRQNKDNDNNQQINADQITITVASDENITLDSNSTFKTKKGSTWQEIKDQARAKITVKDGFNFNNWHLTNKGGRPLYADDKFFEDTTVFATSTKIVPPSGFYWVSVACGQSSTYAIRNDGTLWACGWNDEGQLGLGTRPNKNEPSFVRVGTDTDWAKAEGGGSSCFLLKKDGTLWACGESKKGIQGTNTSTSNKTPKQIGTDTDWKDMAISHFFAYNGFAIKNSGEMWGWGDNNFGRVPKATGKVIPAPIKVSDDADWEQVSTGQYQALAIKKDGSLWGWGGNFQKAVGFDTNDKVVKEITKIGTDTDWKRVRAVTTRTYAIKKDGTLWGCGENTNNIIGLNQQGDIDKFVVGFKKIEGISGKVVDVSGDTNFTVIAVGDQDGIDSFYTWGFNYDGALGDGNGKLWDGGAGTDIPFSVTPIKVPLPEGLKYSMLAAGDAYTAVLAKNGKIYGWGRNRGGQLGQNVDIDQLKSSIFKTPVELKCPQD